MDICATWTNWILFRSAMSFLPSLFSTALESMLFFIIKIVCFCFCNYHHSTLAFCVDSVHTASSSINLNVGKFSKDSQTDLQISFSLVWQMIGLDFICFVLNIKYKNITKGLQIYDIFLETLPKNHVILLLNTT